MTAPGHVFVYGILLVQATEKAAVEGYRLEQHGFMSAVPADGEVIYGGLVPLDDAKLREFDRIEGYRPWNANESFYDRVEVDARTSDGATVRAWMYVMQERHRKCPRWVGDYMLDAIRREYRRLGHTEEAYEELYGTTIVA